MVVYNNSTNSCRYCVVTSPSVTVRLSFIFIDTRKRLLIYVAMSHASLRINLCPVFVPFPSGRPEQTVIKQDLCGGRGYKSPCRCLAALRALLQRVTRMTCLHYRTHYFQLLYKSCASANEHTW